MKKNKKYWALLYSIIITPFMFFFGAVLLELFNLLIIYITSDIDFIFDKEYIYIACKFAICLGFPSGIIFWLAECRRYGIKIFGK